MSAGLCRFCIPYRIRRPEPVSWLLALFQKKQIGEYAEYRRIRQSASSKADSEAALLQDATFVLQCALFDGQLFQVILAATEFRLLTIGQRYVLL